ncbi:hypothetical protein [Hymenobacter defluvii]|uniref:DUF3575 domain-containing protein n=1 Tax=Hymenobacter defluvii TaxID=2054411 RepID=A0ABS3TDK4_9BACT|nr:hypothetical protein [Hymenobacter defluvii]MBO3271258.1 hypothetical protein [Hymenobacter defluvii]
MLDILLLVRRCFLVGIVLTPVVVAGQTAPDSTRISYSEEVLRQPLQVDTMALRVQREERALLKVGLNNFTPGGGYQRYGIHLIYERKVGRAWSVMGEISPAWLHYYRYDYNSRQAQSGPSVRAQLAGRFYYNLERRIRQGHNAGNFSANYLSAALGAGFGRYSDLPFFLTPLGGRRVHAQVALLYGLQRRLGRYGFVDVNAGYVRLLTNEGSFRQQLTGSVRVGLVLGGAAVASPYVPEVMDGVLTPQWYVGAQVGAYGYAVRSSGNYYSYRRGTIIGPYLYVGYYLRPRLAVQLGLQYDHKQYNDNFYPTGQGYYETSQNEYNLAVPVLLRYALTKLPQQRVQVDVVAGAALVFYRLHYQRKEYVPSQIEPTIITGGREKQSAVNPMLGLSLAYGFGRTRRVQVTAEGVFIRPLLSAAYGLQPGLSIGLRYRFKYR